MESSRDDLRARLVAAARAELDEHGRGRVSLRAVARRAGVSHAAPAYSFGDRAGMLSAVAAEGFAQLAAELDAPVPEDTSALAELGTRYVAFAQRNPALYDLMFRPDEVDETAPDLIAARQASLRALIAATGGAEEGNPTALTVISWALAHGLASLDAQGAIGSLTTDATPANLLAVYARVVEVSH
ncbi:MULTISPECIES: TetR/AcrR family transcriptional regulator [Microbacterium]|uniref:TetR/AcrR family transcriptional regulator n=1 Tax=Microbacterium TaxID=33882 RepID=UPI002788EE56|nr:MULTISPECIES: TetR-like C-terminal domain-containing protein [Microbacterium]MDQ1083343.1 AcrR family transcriptional regulator [Microbacterium sp. SORGH_AS_0344]MDQ1171377.1 AcrR family transcriptional regulator [Microbacterium proteolyticum]